MTDEEQAAAYYKAKTEKLIADILALPDNVIISYDAYGKHFAYTSECFKRVAREALER